jgi:hypothetical protein
MPARALHAVTGRAVHEAWPIVPRVRRTAASAAGGGVLSVGGRVGAVIADSSSSRLACESPPGGVPVIRPNGSATPQLRAANKTRRWATRCSEPKSETQEALAIQFTTPSPRLRTAHSV